MKKPPLLTSLFNPYFSDRPSHGPRKDLDIPYSSTVCGLNSFQIKYAHFWNPPGIRDLLIYSRFKKSIKQHLLKNDFTDI